MALPRLYDDLVWVWPFLSPPAEYVAEVRAFREQFRRLGVHEGGTLLHLGSGGGSLDWHLKQHYRLTGVDVSGAMRAHASGVNPEVEYLAGDLRTVRLGRTFDAMLVHDAIAYMTTPADLAAAYQTAAAHLAPGGALVALPEQLEERFGQHTTMVETRDLGARSVTSVMVDFDPDPTDTTIETTFVFLIREDGQLTVETDTHRVGIYPLETFVGAVRAAGFDVEVVSLPLEDPPEEEPYPVIVGVRR